jgi:hypothetical protein
MKAERRHELQTNELADMVGRWALKYRDYLPGAVMAALAVVAVIVAVSLWGARRSGAVASAWQEYDRAATGNSPSDIASRLRQVASLYPDTEVALWARLDLADVFTTEGRQKLDTDRENAVARLREARQIYAEVLAAPKVRPEMIQRAALAEAKCHELMGDRAPAIESYRAAAQKYEKEFPQLAKEATNHAAELEQPEAADFYAWLAQYKPPASRSLTPPSLDSVLPPPGDDKPETTAEQPTEKTKTESEGASSDTEPAGESGKSPEPSSEKTDDKSKPADDAAPKPEQSSNKPTAEQPKSAEQP